METIALEGHFPLCPAVYHTYLPAELPYELRNDWEWDYSKIEETKEKEQESLFNISRKYVF